MFLSPFDGSVMPGGAYGRRVDEGESVDDRFRYDGKRALVVGCFSGMGAATAKIVQSLGGDVHGVDYREPDYDLGGFTKCDLRDKREIDAMLASLTSPVNSVFYCAGLPQTHPPFDVMTVNFAAMRQVVEGVQPIVPIGGAIAIISSNAGLQFMAHMAPISELLATDGFDGACAWCEAHPDVVADGYTFSKEAIIVYTMQRALDIVDEGVRINCISPGPTATPMMPEFEKAAGPELIRAFWGPMNRQAQPEEMGWPLAFLNSDAASFITGLNLIVDAGFVAGVTTGKIDLNALFAQGMEALAARQS
jgi:NAD(P)-dependent dehydrogenase (short-subunit alcohol dehydrogenase family)